MTDIQRKRDLRHCSREELAQFILNYSVDAPNNAVEARKRLTAHLYGATDAVILHRCQKAERDNLNLRCRVEVLEIQLQWQQQAEKSIGANLCHEYQWREQEHDVERQQKWRTKLDGLLSQGSSDAASRSHHDKQKQKEQEQKQKQEQEQVHQRKQEPKQKQQKHKEHKQKPEQEQIKKQEQNLKHEREPEQKQKQEQEREQNRQEQKLKKELEQERQRDEEQKRNQEQEQESRRQQEQKQKQEQDLEHQREQEQKQEQTQEREQQGQRKKERKQEQEREQQSRQEQKQKKKQEQEHQRKQERKRKQEQEQEHQREQEQQRKQEQEKEQEHLRRQLQRDREHAEGLKLKRKAQRNQRRRGQVTVPAALGQLHVMTDDEDAELEVRRKVTLQEEKRKDNIDKQRKDGDVARNDETHAQPSSACVSGKDPSQKANGALVQQHEAFVQPDISYQMMTGMADGSTAELPPLGIAKHSFGEADIDGCGVRTTEALQTSEKLSIATSSKGRASQKSGVMSFACADDKRLYADSSDSDMSRAAAVKWGFSLPGSSEEEHSVANAVEREALSFAFVDGHVPVDLTSSRAPIDDDIPQIDSDKRVVSPAVAVDSEVLAESEWASRKPDKMFLRVDPAESAAEVQHALPPGSSVESENIYQMNLAQDDNARTTSRPGAFSHQDSGVGSISFFSDAEIKTTSHRGLLESDINVLAAGSEKHPVAVVSAEQHTPACDAADKPHATESDTIVGTFGDNLPLQAPVSLVPSSCPTEEIPASMSPTREMPAPSLPGPNVAPRQPAAAPPPFLNTRARKPGRRVKALAAPTISMETRRELLREDARPSMSPDRKSGHESAATLPGEQGSGVTDYVFAAPVPETASIDSKYEGRDNLTAMPVSARLPVDSPSFALPERELQFPQPPLAQEEDPAVERRVRLRRKLAEVPEMALADTASPRMLHRDSKFFPPRGDGYESASEASVSSESSVWFIDYFLPKPEPPVDPEREALKDLPVLSWGAPIPIDLPPLFRDEEDVAPPENAVACVDDGLQSPKVAEVDAQPKRPRRGRAQAALPAIAQEPVEDDAGWFGLW